MASSNTPSTTPPSNTPSFTPPSKDYFLSRLNDPTTRSVKLSSITKLARQENYNTWASTMAIIWRSLKVYELVVEGKRPEKGCSHEEMNAFSLRNHALTV
ncbi:hypothetical protein K3495_g2660 [Podosphaera aphanis]|nr:hypothetical protein K3495_g2660 [Podosphaera aphanis]